MPMKTDFCTHSSAWSAYVSPKARLFEINTKRLLCQSPRVITGARTEEFEYDGNYFDE